MSSPATTSPASEATDPARAVAALRTLDERLPPRVRDEILALGDAAVPHLIEMLLDEDLEGYGPVHAAALLGDLKATEAIEPLLQALRRTESLDWLHDHAIGALTDIGPPALEPVLRAHAEEKEADQRYSLASILASLGVEDERIYEILIREFEADPGLSAGNLAQYGDARAIEYLSRAFDAHELKDTDSPSDNHDLIEYRAAIRELGGSLTPEQERKFKLSQQSAHRFRRDLNRALEGYGERVREKHGQEPVRHIAKPGRNEPCWCGSGVKYKKCHLAADERS